MQFFVIYQHSVFFTLFLLWSKKRCHFILLFLTALRFSHGGPATGLQTSSLPLVCYWCLKHFPQVSLDLVCRYLLPVWTSMCWTQASTNSKRETFLFTSGNGWSGWDHQACGALHLDPAPQHVFHQINMAWYINKVQAYHPCLWILLTAITHTGWYL